MRNLKKALALVLALMMTLSLMVTASASDYADDSAIEQDEAVSVMSALGVFNGMSDGTFDPDGNLTRAQAAKIITYMLLDKDVADSLENTGSKFADCKDGRWYVGAVNYLTDLGIVTGRNETTFDPNGKVNGYEFAKMLLGALGYDSKTERFEGESSWSINIATAARRAGLDEGLSVSTISSVALTREQAAKLAFNTLKATMVYYEGGVVVGDVTVNPTRKEVSNAKSNHYDKTVTEANRDDLMQFCEQYFPELKYENYSDPDDFSRTPDGRWVNGKANAYVNLAEPALVLTEGVNEAGLKKLLKGVKETSSNVEIKGFGNSDTATGSKTIANIAALTDDGKQVEIYLNAEGDEIAKVITITYKVETVTAITEKNNTTNYRFSATAGSTWTNTEDATKVVLAGDVAKGDVVTTVIANNTLYVYPTSTFTGSQTAKKGTTVTIGGAQYDIGTGLSNVSAASFTNSKDEANYWVDMNGYLVKVEGIETEQEINYAIITGKVWGKDSTPTLDNPTPGYVVNVRALLDDGSVLDATLKLGKAEGTNYITCGDVNFGNENLSDGVVDAQLGTGSKLFGYYMDDGKMVLKNVTAANTSMTKDDVRYQNLDADPAYKGGTSRVDDGITALFNSKTVFVIYKVENGKVTAETHTGTSGLAIDKETGVSNGTIIMSATAAAQGTATVVFLKTEVVAPVVDYVYIDKDDVSSVLNDDGDSVYAYTGIAVDGTEDTYYTAKNVAALTKSGLYSYDADKVINTTALVDTATTADDHADAAATYERVVKAQVNDELIYVGNAWVKMTDDTQVVLADGIETVAGSNCFVVMKDASEVAAIFAYEAPTALEATVASQTATVATSGSTTIAVTCDKSVTVTAASSDTAKATVSVADKTVTVNGVAAGTATVTITVTPTGADAEHYNPTTITVDVTVTAAAAE